MNIEIQDIFKTGERLPVVDQFYSIQGEGFHTGKAAYFVRLGGCDIGCNWCDTKISWNQDIHRAMSVKEIFANVLDSKADSFVVTGGEPSLYKLDALCKTMKDSNIKTYLETSGNHKITGEWDWICLSPKRNNPPLKENLIIANELKVIISDENDIVWAENCVQYIKDDCLLFLQPEWSKRKIITSVIIEYIKQHPEWNLSVQLHKYLGIP